MSIDRWMDKGVVLQIYNRILLSHKTELNNAICSYLDGPRDDHTKWNKSEKNKTNIMWKHLHMEPKYDTDEPTHKTETNSQT